MTYYINIKEGEIRTVISALKRYNTMGTRYLFFTIFPLLQNGEFNNKDIHDNKFYIPSDKSFEFVYGKLYIDFYIYDGNKIDFVLNDRTKYVYYSLYQSSVKVIDGLPIIDENALFKYRMYKKLRNRQEEKICLKEKEKKTN